MESIAFYKNLIEKVFPVMGCFKEKYLEDGLKLVLKKNTKEEISEIALMAYQDANIFQNIGQVFKNEVMEGKPTKEQMKGFLDTALFELSSIGYGWKEQHYLNFRGHGKFLKEDRGLLKVVEDIETMACWADIQTLRLLDSIEEVAVYIGYELPKWWYRADGNEEITGDLVELPKEKKVYSFWECILVSDKDGLLKKLHTLIDGKKGKFVAEVIYTCKNLGLIKEKPKFPVIEREFNGVGSKQGFNNYYSKPYTFDNGELQNIRAFLTEFL